MNKFIFFILVLSLTKCQNVEKKSLIKTQEYVRPSVTISIPTKNNEIKFIETEKTFNKQLEKFRGKTVFIDTWFTNCGSCIKQFKYTKDLKEFFKENDIVSLYICFGDLKDKNKWKELINNLSST